MKKHFDGKSERVLTFRRLFLYLWLSAVLVFVIQILINVKYFVGFNLVPNWIQWVILANIGLGIFFFFGILGSGKRVLERKRLPKYINVWSLSVVYMLILVTPVFASAEIQNRKLIQKVVVPTNFVHILPTISTTPTVSPKKNIDKYVPKHDGTRTGNIVQYYSYCEKKNINVYENELMLYTRKSGVQIYSTKADVQCYEKDFGELAKQNIQPVNQNTYTTNYPPCTIYYPALGYSTTYNYTSPEQCQKWKSEVSSTSTPAPTVTSSPTAMLQPTTDPSLCAGAVTMWNEYKEDFYATRYDTYSSSFEAIQVLEYERQTIQNQIYSYGCSNTISL